MKSVFFYFLISNDLSNNATMDARQFNGHNQAAIPPLLRAYRPQTSEQAKP